jgi:membrane protein
MEMVKLLVEAFKEWTRDRSGGLAASLAYFELLCVGPVVGFILFISDKILGQVYVYQEVLPMLKKIITPQLTKVIILLLSTEKGIKAQELTTISILSGLLLLWAGKEYFEQIKKTVETTWNKRRDKFGLKAKIKRTVKAFKIACMAVGIIILSVWIGSLLPHQSNEAGSEHANSAASTIAHWIAGIVIMGSLRIFYFTYIPPVKINWVYTIPGAILNAILFLIGREVMQAHFNNRPDADAAESVIMVLLWFYYSNLIFIYSSEFTRLYVTRKQNMDFINLKSD